MKATPSGFLITSNGAYAETQNAEIDAGLTVTMLSDESGSAVLIGSREGTSATP